MLIGWVLLCPKEAFGLIDKLKINIQDYLLNYFINQEIKSIKFQMKKWCKQNGYERRLVDEVLDEHVQKIIKLLESKYSQVDFNNLF